MSISIIYYDDVHCDMCGFYGICTYLEGDDGCVYLCKKCIAKLLDAHCEHENKNRKNAAFAFNKIEFTIDEASRALKINTGKENSIDLMQAIRDLTKRY